MHSIPSPRPVSTRRETSVFTDTYAEISDIDARVDGQITPKQSGFVRYAEQRAELICEGCGGRSANAGNTLIPRDALVMGHTWVLGTRFLNEFRQEARIMVELNDPTIVRLYEYVETREGAAIVMELVDGAPLRRILSDHGATSPEAALVVLKGSLTGLSLAHASGIVHRHYKPECVE